MTRTGSMGALAAVLMLGTQPCFAADDRDLGARSTAAFAGASVKLNFGHRNQPKPKARLQLGMRHSFVASPHITHQVNMLELGTGKTGKPAFYMAGQDIGDTKRQLGVRGTTGTVLLVAGGVVVAVVAAAALTAASEKQPCKNVPYSEFWTCIANNY